MRILYFDQAYNVALADNVCAVKQQIIRDWSQEKGLPYCYQLVALLENEKELPLGCYEPLSCIAICRDLLTKGNADLSDYERLPESEMKHYATSRGCQQTNTKPSLLDIEDAMDMGIIL